MPNSNKSQKPILNPALSLLTKPRLKSVPGRGKESKHIDQDRLSTNIAYLREELPLLREQYGDKIFANKVIFKAKLQTKYSSPSHTPDDLFSDKDGAEYLTSTNDGHLFEIEQNKIGLIAESLAKANIRKKVDISRLDSVEPYMSKFEYSPDQINQIWNSTISNKNGYKEFAFWLMPFLSSQARKSVITSLLSHIENNIDINIQDKTIDDSTTSWVASSRSSFSNTLKSKINLYLTGKNPRFSFTATHADELLLLVGSGIISRLQPKTKFQSSMPPGKGKEPERPLTRDLKGMPIVAVIDGGLTAHSYFNAVAYWPTDKLISDKNANNLHGNQVSSLIVDATGWNNNLNIPDLPCRIVPMQCLSKSIDESPDDDDFIQYIDHMMNQYADVNIWNISCNQMSCCDKTQISHIGAELGRLSREHNKLFIISAGNIADDETTIAPPADCESALVVGGRSYDDNGMVAGPCQISRTGLGPSKLHKPELSWFSKVRVLGGEISSGTSYSAPQIARIAAHTWANLTDPTPDIVRSLLINNCDLDSYCPSRGWGSPNFSEMPWVCSDEAATLVWTSELNSGVNYYWHDIAIPSTMLDENNKLKGEIILTAILDPEINPLPIGNPILSRLEVSLQRSSGGTNLLGSSKTSTGCDSSISKWNPIRVHKKKFVSTYIPDGLVRLRARILYRDRSRLTRDMDNTLSEIKSSVAFSLTFKSNNPDTYNSFVRQMGVNVRPAVVETDIEVEI